MKTIAVIGLGFGDEGKGRVVDYLCSVAEAPLVVRFSGGHQAAHHVIHIGEPAKNIDAEHVFAQFGSGTLAGASTYWTKKCPLSPTALMREYDILREKGIRPWLTIDGESPLTTPYEMAHNRNNGHTLQCGSCGVGIFETIERERKGFHLLARDILFPRILRTKLAQLYDWRPIVERVEPIEAFLEACERIQNISDGCIRDITIRNNLDRSLRRMEEDCEDSEETIIFEGSQGLMLDQEYGFFPHVTPSNTGTKNILALGVEPEELWLVTRAYQTRHGNGPMSPIVLPNAIQDNPYEMNGNDGLQGPFRRTLLDLDMLRYAVNADSYIRRHPRTLVITCMDLVTDEHRLIDNGKVVECRSTDDFITRVQKAVGAFQVYLSFHASGPLIRSLK